MSKVKEFFKMIITKSIVKSCKNIDIYNTEIFRGGMKKLLNDYKEILEKADNDTATKTKIKELDFHLNILNKTSDEYLN